MSTYVLVHGACHGSWCWDKVAPLLKQAGHRVEAFDLPGSGQNKTPLSQVTLAAYTRRACEILDSQSESVILLGHSTGGAVITQAAEERPEKIRTLVYLTAILVQNGESAFQIASLDTGSLVLPSLIVNEEQGYYTFKEEALKEVFYDDCSDEEVERAKRLLVPQALAPLVTPVSTTMENFGRVPKVYIECLRDRAISPSYQKKMYMALPFEKIFSLDTSHSPFFSAPQELVKHLHSLEQMRADGT